MKAKQVNPLFQWIYHFIFWYCYIILINFPIFSKVSSPNFLNIIIDFYIYWLLVIGIIVYAQCYFLYRFGKSIFQKIGISIGIFLIYYLLRFIRIEILLSIDFEGFTTISNNLFISSFVNWFFFSAFGLGLFISIETIEKKAQLIKLEKDNLEKNLEILEVKRNNSLLLINTQKAELEKLKAQINPHFLFNSLNFFYAEIRPFNKKAAESIILLSDILRYSLVEHANKDLVDIEEEVEYLKNYIQLQRNRFYDNFHLNLDIDWQQEIRDLKIPSMVLLTLVENCFKYGDLHDPDNPCLINISVENDIFIFIVKNKIQPKNPLLTSTGMGMTNIKNRLDLIYEKNKYTLVSNTNNNTYVCRLQIVLT